MIEVHCHHEASVDMTQHNKILLAPSMGCLLSLDLTVIPLLSLPLSVKVLMQNLAFKIQASTQIFSKIWGARASSYCRGRGHLETLVFRDMNKGWLKFLLFNI